MENPRRGAPGWVGAGGRGAGRVSAGNFGGRALNIFFRGRNSHQENITYRFVGFGELFSVIATGTLQHEISGGIDLM